eukprot:350318-Chlamydomonas_euryale.AAC.21
MADRKEGSIRVASASAGGYSALSYVKSDTSSKRHPSLEAHSPIRWPLRVPPSSSGPTPGSSAHCVTRPPASFARASASSSLSCS